MILSLVYSCGKLDEKLVHKNDCDKLAGVHKFVYEPIVVSDDCNCIISGKVKYLKDYPDWQFLSQDELNRKTIEIHEDIKKAKRCCNKEQKVIKVPNTNVFKIVAPILVSRGISRIVNADKLIAL